MIDISPIKSHIKQQRQSIIQDFYNKKQSIENLIALWTKSIDEIIINLWNQQFKNDNNLILIAVGGYGRSELHPYSDIDVLILIDENYRHKDLLENFVQTIWDTGLDIGSSVRTIAECKQMIAQDVTVATNILEARYLTGAKTLWQNLQNSAHPSQIWSAKDFLQAKLLEQKQRYKKSNNTGNRLEPNIKESPGGLRDIHMLEWMNSIYFKNRNLYILVEKKLLCPEEYQKLLKAKHFLWQIRFILHDLAGKKEDRLLFDYQKQLAEYFQYYSNQPNGAVEAFMCHYFRTINHLTYINELLLHTWSETLLLPQGEKIPLDQDFYQKNNYIDFEAPQDLSENAHLLLKIFIKLQEHPEIKGLSVNAIRSIHAHLHLIDENYSQTYHALFMQILKSKQKVSKVLRLMNRYSILGAYLPSFDQITGRMQYDLFHTYTVEEHTLFVIHNLEKFNEEDKYFRNKLFKQIEKKEVLYLAALFHDIGKGRGGDHSELGAEDALDFAKIHYLETIDTNDIVWLVQQHLLMSLTAQKKDIDDSEVIKTFANKVSSKRRLDYLYLLTIADIRATNVNLWNDWKATLLLKLYRATLQYLNQEQTQPEMLSLRQLLQQVDEKDVEHIKAIWYALDKESSYFQDYLAEDIIWHTQALTQKTLPQILLRKKNKLASSEIFIYTKLTSWTFSYICAVLEKLSLNILEAHIHTFENQYMLATFLVLNQNGSIIEEGYQSQEIEHYLEKYLKNPTQDPQKTFQPRSPSRQVRQFAIPLYIHFEREPQKGCSVLHLHSSDKPGLLSIIGRAFRHANVQIRRAKVATLDKRIEDVFWITNEKGNFLNLKTQKHLQEILQEELTNII